jgi:hypothetical protein
MSNWITLGAARILLPLIGANSVWSLKNEFERQRKKKTPSTGLKRQLELATVASNLSIVAAATAWTAHAWMPDHLGQKRGVQIASNLLWLPLVVACGYDVYLGSEWRSQLQVSQNKRVENGMTVTDRKTTWSSPGPNGPTVYQQAFTKTKPLPPKIEKNQ